MSSASGTSGSNGTSGAGDTCAANGGGGAGGAGSPGAAPGHCAPPGVCGSYGGATYGSSAGGPGKGAAGYGGMTYGVPPYGGPSNTAVPVSRADLAADVQLALDLARGRATGEAADALRVRLRRAIVAYAPLADAYAAQLADSRAREIVTHMVCHAWAVAQDPGQDPAVNLRLLAKAVDHLARYAAAARHMAPTDLDPGAC
ncbi:hypothetical protein [Streptomyces sp. NPDC060184]|uniref:hypothetical protein n=1 Tax=Streptomyces sp. NPDC060184 TaxID=3347064 RepID=UPI00365C3760